MQPAEVRKIEQANPIIEVARELGIKIRSNMGQCFNHDRHRSEDGSYTLFFNLSTNSFFCKVCPDVGGSVTDLVCQCQKWDRQKTLDWLVHRVQFDLKTQKLYHGKGRKK